MLSGFLDGTTLNTTGLLMDIFGVILLYKFGLPPSVNRYGYQYLIAEREDLEMKAKAARYDRWSYFALFLILGGFVVQIVSNYLP